MKVERFERDYVIHCMKKYKDTMTVTQLAEKLGVNRVRLYELARTENIKMLKSKGGRPRKGPFGIEKYTSDICKGRPQACFNCTNVECCCSDSSNDDETSYLFAGLIRDPYDNIKHKKQGAIYAAKT